MTYQSYTFSFSYIHDYIQFLFIFDDLLNYILGHLLNLMLDDLLNITLDDMFTFKVESF
jgi:hypothetical protein